MVFLHQCSYFILTRSAESGGDVTRVKSDLWSHLTLLIDPYYLSFRGLVFSLLLNNPLRSQFRYLFYMVYEPGQESLHVTHLRPSLVRIQMFLTAFTICVSAST